MPILPAPLTCTLTLAMDEVRVIREALAEYVQRKDLKEEQLDSAWSVLVEVTQKIGRKEQEW